MISQKNKKVKKKEKKTETSTSALGGTAVTEQNSLISSKSPVIRIADFFDYVKTVPLANEVFSENAATKIGITRSKGSLSEDIRYALPEKEIDPFENQQEAALRRGLPTDGKKVNLSAGQARQLRANQNKKKSYSLKEAMQLLESVIGGGDRSPLQSRPPQFGAHCGFGAGIGSHGILRNVTASVRKKQRVYIEFG